MIRDFSDTMKIYLFLILFLGTVLSFTIFYPDKKYSFLSNSNYLNQKDTVIRKIFDESTGDSIDILSLGNLRIVEKDGTIKKNTILKEIHSYWIIYEKDGSLHDFLISAIDRIELGNKKGKAIYFDKKGKATIKWIP
ncbi:MAG: hypothetical protein A3F72_05210 [Bacteroidetes bacterium RIFCSPLOWO2_12_FULL_35_15]|nr:MAG: hypothetical protein A3F72_05210 [Bacteroidetes bacterium RIFCSPLOWO2_12_FULL_35_15]